MVTSMRAAARSGCAVGRQPREGLQGQRTGQGLYRTEVERDRRHGVCPADYAAPSRRARFERSAANYFGAAQRRRHGVRRQGPHRDQLFGQLREAQAGRNSNPHT